MILTIACAVAVFQTAPQVLDPRDPLSHNPLNKTDFVAIVRVVSITEPQMRQVFSHGRAEKGYFQSRDVEVLDSAGSLPAGHATLLVQSRAPRTSNVAASATAGPAPGSVWLVTGFRPHGDRLKVSPWPAAESLDPTSVIPLSADEASAFWQCRTAARRLVAGRDYATTISKTLAGSLTEGSSDEVRDTTAFFLAGTMGAVDRIDGMQKETWLRDVVAKIAVTGAADKDGYIKMRLYALAAHLGEAQGQKPFVHAFVDLLRERPGFYDASEWSALQSVPIDESLGLTDEMIGAADETPNYLAKEFLLSRAAMPQSEAAFRKLIRMLDDATQTGPTPFYVYVLDKLCSLAGRNDLKPPTGAQGPSPRWSQLRAFWKASSCSRLKQMHADSITGK
ncbi:MAG TPA: hypothetical protein VHE55_07665 [Fimbriimonadaceae bacterium]|nr:hypothetical protein [Fimbriimonadaceae bacterium]